VLADIVEIKHIMLPPSPREFKDIYVVFELMETDLHQVQYVCRGVRAHGDGSAPGAVRLSGRKVPCDGLVQSPTRICGDSECANQTKKILIVEP